MEDVVVVWCSAVAVVYLSIYQYINICLSFCFSVYLFVYLSIYLSVYLSIYLSASLKTKQLVLFVFKYSSLAITVSNIQNSYFLSITVNASSIAVHIPTKLRSRLISHCYLNGLTECPLPETIPNLHRIAADGKCVYSVFMYTCVYVMYCNIHTQYIHAYTYIHIYIYI